MYLWTRELIRKIRRPIYVVLSVIFALNALIFSNGLELKLIPSAKAGKLPTESAPLPPPVQDAIAFVDPYIDEALALIESDRQQHSSVSFDYEPKLLYDSLSLEEKAMYDEMLANAQHLIPYSYTAKQYGYEGMDMALNVYGAIKTDYPEIENYFMLYEVNEDNRTIALEARYFMPGGKGLQMADPAMLRQELQRFDAVSNRIIERMPDDFSTYDKYRYLAAVISLITSYDYEKTEGWQIGTAYGSILGGHSICQGYSRGFLYLCQKANLWCKTVEGRSSGNASHMWNIVKLDSGTYYLDITWSDEFGLPGSRGWNSCFMLTQEELLMDHEITDGTVATGTSLYLVNNPQ